MVEALTRSNYWLEEHSVLVRHLIVRHDNNRLYLLTLSTENGDTLPVFSSELTARAFLRFNRYGEQWRVRESTAGELISLLMGHIADVGSVTLDPPSAGRADREAAPEPVDKRDFINALMREPILLASR